jgi:hypothetical protein
MPVSRDALARMGWPSPPPDLPGARHVEVGRDRLTVLGGVVPLPLRGRPVSFGELILLAGLADVAFNATADAAARRARRLGVLRSVCAGTGASGAVCWSDVDLAALEDEGPTVVVLGPVPNPTAPTRPDAARRRAPAAGRRLVLAEPPGGGPERDGPAA